MRGEPRAAARIAARGVVLAGATIVVGPGAVRADEIVTVQCAPTCVADKEPATGDRVRISIKAGGPPKDLRLSLPALGGKLARTTSCTGACDVTWPGLDRLEVVIDGQAQPIFVVSAAPVTTPRGLAVPPIDLGSTGKYFLEAGLPGVDPTKAMGGPSVVPVAPLMPRLGPFGPTIWGEDLPVPSKPRPGATAPAPTAAATTKGIGFDDVTARPETLADVQEALDLYLEDVVVVGDGCSGVVVGRRAVLTARHCAAAERISVERARQRLEPFAVVARDLHPDADTDIAVLWTERELDVPRRASAAGGDPTATGLVRLAGYGTVDATGQRGFGRKRQAYVSISGWGCDARQRARTGCVPGREAVIVAAEADTCRGDSGGPVLIRRGDRWDLIAITSRAVPGRGGACGRGGIYTLLGPVQAWLSTLKRGTD